jgi:hypothetical protein
MNKIKSVNQYFMYGISVPYKYFKEQNWNLNICDDEISCLFDTRDGKYLIIGRVLGQTNDDDVPLLGYKKPFVVPELTKIDEQIIQESVGKQYGVAGKFHYYFITHSE